MKLELSEDFVAGAVVFEIRITRGDMAARQMSAETERKLAGLGDATPFDEAFEVLCALIADLRRCKRAALPGCRNCNGTGMVGNAGCAVCGGVSARAADCRDQDAHKAAANEIERLRALLEKARLWMGAEPRDTPKENKRFLDTLALIDAALSQPTR